MVKRHTAFSFSANLCIFMCLILEKLIKKLTVKQIFSAEVNCQ